MRSNQTLLAVQNDSAVFDWHLITLINVLAFCASCASPPSPATASALFRNKPSKTTSSRQHARSMSVAATDDEWELIKSPTKRQIDLGVIEHLEPVSCKLSYIIARPRAPSSSSTSTSLLPATEIANPSTKRAFILNFNLGKVIAANGNLELKSWEVANENGVTMGQVLRELQYSVGVADAPFGIVVDEESIADARDELEKAYVAYVKKIGG